ncbi:MAG: hypothetical protein P4L50_00805 [Anaerolineaceae bacterium]|nr:hypothetical protein [Anaerolineaceae bacterium]
MSERHSTTVRSLLGLADKLMRSSILFPVIDSTITRFVPPLRIMASMEREVSSSTSKSGLVVSPSNGARTRLTSAHQVSLHRARNLKHRPAPSAADAAMGDA